MIYETDKLKHDDLLSIYRMNYNKLSKCIQKLCWHLLGNDYTIVDSVDETTACEIITEDIIRNYKDVNKSKHWRLYNRYNNE